MNEGELLRGQVAIVTGAGRGVGRAIAEGLAAAGAAVAVAARSAPEIEEAVAAILAAGGKAEALRTDVTDQAGVEELVHATTTRLGPPSLLVNSAGTWRHVGPLANANADDWWEDVEVSLRGTFLCTRAVLPGMLERGFGRIVNVTSYAATGARPYATAYAASRAAVLRLTDSLAAEIEEHGVLAFAVTPGFVRTRLVEDVASSRAGRTYLPELEARKDALDPERAARLVCEIASGRLDPLAGRLLHVLDDLEALLLRAEEIRAGDFLTLRLRTLPPDNLGT